MEPKIKPIRTESDYRAMVALVDELIDAEAGTEAYDTLQIASDLVWKWEQEHICILPPDPVEAIKFRLEQLELSLRDLRPYIGSDARVSEVMSGKRDLTLNMVRALNRHLGIPLESLVPDRELKASRQALDKSPVQEMAKLGWLSQPTSDAVSSLQKDGEADSFDLVLCKQNSNSYVNAKTDPTALYWWCLHVRSEAKRQECRAEFCSDRLDERFMRDLGHLSMLEDGPTKAKQSLAEIGICLVFAKHLRGTFLDGAAMLLKDGRPVIGMTLRHDRLDNFWYCLLHELSHVRLHLGQEGAPRFFHDDFDVRGDLDEVEEEADELASNSLLPTGALAPLGNLRYVSTSSINHLALQYRVHPAIVAGRVRFETGNYTKFAKMLGHGIPKKVLGVCW